MSELFTNVEVKPLKFQGKKTSNILANGRVLVDGFLRVNFSVMNGRNGLWVKLPQHTYQAKDRETGQVTTRYIRDVIIEDEAKKTELSELILAEYQRVADSPPQADQSPPTNW